MIDMTTVLVGEEEPMQPVGVDQYGTHRFLENRIVRDMVEFARPHGFDLNEMATRAAQGQYSQSEREQFAQLIGYSVCGYLDLSYVSNKSADRAIALDEQLEADSNEE